jgi:NTP pyrophosphatase (non-canonical NTP hydrolase)
LKAIQEGKPSFIAKDHMCPNGHISERDVKYARCRACVTLRTKRYYSKLDPTLKIIKQKEQYIKHKARNLRAGKEWAKKNPEKVKAIKKRNKLKHKLKYREAEKNRLIEKRKADPFWRANKNISKQIWAFLNGKKAGRSWESIIKASFEDIKIQLEKKFTAEMSWENYGTYWEIDHIKPLNLFPQNDAAVAEAWHPNNLQPLELHLNRSKQDFGILLAEEMRYMGDIKPSVFVQGTEITAIKNYSGASHRLQDEAIIKLFHAGVGVNTEAGELLDSLKKHIFYGKPLDRTNLLEELGDILHYVAKATTVLDTTLEEVMEINLKKLRVRYGEEFSEDAALNRDINKELEAVDGSK